MLRQRIIDSQRNPNLPTHVFRLIQAFSKEDLDYRELTKIIEDHPVIAARLIALANSAWAAPAIPVNSIERACLNLGLMIVRSVSIGFALISSFNISSCPAFDIRRFWITSKLVADGARLLASCMPTQPSSFLQTVYTAGLLHNLGLLCLADIMPKETQEALLSINKMPDQPLNEALYQKTETDYCEIGGLFAEIWGLPQDLTTVIKHHRDENYQGPYKENTLLIRNAAHMVGALFRDQQTLPPQTTLDKLGISHSDQQLTFDKMQLMFLETSELAKTLF